MTLEILFPAELGISWAVTSSLIKLLISLDDGVSDWSLV